MESEKVKEIKKALECCINNKGCNLCTRGKLPYDLDECRLVLTNDILTLINELESENEWLVGKIKEKNSERADCLLKTQQLKDRIAELEKENAKLLDSVETVQSNRCTTKCELTKKQLTKFAERLKQELKGIIGANFIDETLKEFIDD